MKRIILWCLCLVLTTMPILAQAVDMNKARYLAVGADGYAVVQDEKTQKWVCVSTNGTVKPLSDQMRTGIYNGYGMDINHRLRDIEGNVYYSIDDGIYVIDGLEALDVGLFMVVRTTESYNGVKYEFGTLSVKGEWIEPLSEKHPLLNYGFEIDTSESMRYKIGYKGNGIYLFKLGHNAYKETGCIYAIYDALNGQVYPFEGSWPAPDSDILFREDGALVWDYAYNRIYRMSRTGEKEPIAKMSKKASDEVDGKSCLNGDRFFTYYSDRCTLWDRECKLIKNFGDLKIYPYGTFVNGYAPAIIQNDVGTLYFTLIGENGSFKFEPVKIDSSHYQLPYLWTSTDMNDSIVCFDGTYTILQGVKTGGMRKGNYYVYDDNGSLVNSFSDHCYYGEITVVGQNNGVFCYRVSDFSQMGYYLFDYCVGTETPSFQ